MKRLMAALLILLLAASFVTAGGRQEADPADRTYNWVWNISGTGTASSPYGLTARYMADEIRERSDGRLNIELNYGGALGYQAAQMLETTSERLVDGGDLSLPHIAGSDALGNFGSLPFLHFGYDEYWNWLDELLFPRLSEHFTSKWDVLPIGSFTFGSMYLLWTEPLNSIEQVRGERFRVFGDINIELFERMGVNVIYLPVEELQTALERNMIDGMPNSNPLIEQLEAWEYYGYRNDLGAVIGSSLFVVNRTAFNALPADLQQIVLEVGREATLRGRELLIADDARMTQVLDGKGMVTHPVPESVINEMRGLGRTIWESWAQKTSPLAADIMSDTFKMLNIQ